MQRPELCMPALLLLQQQQIITNHASWHTCCVYCKELTIAVG
jgi:hypothetical protein